MFSLLIVALFAALSLSVSARPAQRSGHSHTNSTSPTSSPYTPTSAPYTPTSSPPTTPTTTSVPVSSPTPTAVSLAAYTGGYATYFYQNGVAGACGTVHSDSDYICAMDQALFGTLGPASPLCGKQVQITNLDNGKMVTVTVADDCPTCSNANSIDLSVAAFEALDDLSVGIFPISWVYL